MKTVADQVHGRGVVLDADEDIEPPLPEGSAPTLGSPRVSAGPTAVRSARSTRVTTTARHCAVRRAPVRGFGGGACGGALVHPLGPQRRERPGVQRGGSIPSPEPEAHSKGMSSFRLPLTVRPTRRSTGASPVLALTRFSPSAVDGRNRSPAGSPRSATRIPSAFRAERDGWFRRATRSRGTLSGSGRTGEGNSA